MKSNRLSGPPIHASKWLGRLAALAGAVALTSFAPVMADGPGQLAGIYKVTASSDPLFRPTRTREYFLDFGRGIQRDRLSGSVAVSIRRNPHVRVRILAWEYFPLQEEILLGNPFAAGSRNAVAIASWRMRGIANGAIFERGRFRVVLQRADPNDY